MKWEKLSDVEIGDLECLDQLMVRGRLERSNRSGYLDFYEVTEAFYSPYDGEWFSSRSRLRNGKLELLKVSDVTHVLRIKDPR